MQTLFFMTEGDSFGVMESMVGHMFTNASIRELMEKCSKVVDSHEVTIVKKL